MTVWCTSDGIVSCLLYAAYGGLGGIFTAGPTVCVYRSPFPVLGLVSDNYGSMPLQLSLCCLQDDFLLAAGLYWHLRRLFVSIKLGAVAEVAGGGGSGAGCLRVNSHQGQALHRPPSPPDNGRLSPCPHTSSARIYGTANCRFIRPVAARGAGWAAVVPA